MSQKRFTSLARTAKALDEYDRRRAAGEFPSGEPVGIAFGEDTKAFNDPETCRACVRPGKKHPSHPDDLSFVRRMVAAWKEQEVNNDDDQ